MARSVSTIHELPSGLTVEFYKNPRHEYYFPPDPVKVDSISTIVDAVNDGSLFGVASWYGQKVGARGVKQLARLERDTPEDFFMWLIKADDDKLQKALTASKLTVNHNRESAANRGTAIHDIAERYAKEGKFPEVTVPAEHMGYVRALKKWVKFAKPKFTHSEIVVASKEHRFAGTFDGLCTIDGKRCLVDYKTSKKGVVYTKAHLQAAGYELALYESYGIEIDEKWIIGLDMKGEPHPVQGSATPGDFLATLDLYNRLKELESRTQKVAA